MTVLAKNQSGVFPSVRSKGKARLAIIEKVALSRREKNLIKSGETNRQTLRFKERIMMRNRGLYLLMSLAVLAGCSPTDSGNEIPDHSIPDPQIEVVGYAQVQSPTQSGKALYSISCELQYTGQSKSNSDFNSATVTVNGSSLGRYSDGYFVNTDSMRFSQGDSLEFVVRHAKIGTIKEIIQVPPPVQNYSVVPSLPINNFANVNTTFLVSWNPVSANLYYLICDCYNSREVFVTETWFSTSADSIAVALEDSADHAYPFLQLRLLSFNAVPLSGFSPGSGFYVGSPYYQVHSNL